jgi:hypothetical protein
MGIFIRRFTQGMAGSVVLRGGAGSGPAGMDRLQCKGYPSGVNRAMTYPVAALKNTIARLRDRGFFQHNMRQ